MVRARPLPFEARQLTEELAHVAHELCTAASTHAISPDTGWDEIIDAKLLELLERYGLYRRAMAPLLMPPKELKPAA